MDPKGLVFVSVELHNVLQYLYCCYTHEYLLIGAPVWASERRLHLCSSTVWMKAPPWRQSCRISAVILQSAGAAVMCAASRRFLSTVMSCFHTVIHSTASTTHLGRQRLSLEGDKEPLSSLPLPWSSGRQQHLVRLL